jgi:ABC-2 type transport system ATP-binding protein/lipopolysaccharide transport system ATP-binding protein
MVHIELDRVSLNIPVSLGQRRLFRKSTLTSAVGGRLTAQKDTIVVDALNDVSIKLSRGEHLGLIGHNGAGKSTLLKLIAGIYPPSRGNVQVEGSIGCLINMNLGMSEDMSGYEYVRYFASILSKNQMDWEDLAKDVADFTELGDFMEMPIRTYSLGMRTRLAAALITAEKHDILLIDEGIGAGDAKFQAKFRSRLTNFLEQAQMLVIASHSMDLLLKYCTKGLILNKGSVEYLGPIQDALERQFGKKDLTAAMATL